MNYFLGLAGHDAVGEWQDYVSGIGGQMNPLPQKQPALWDSIERKNEADHVPNTGLPFDAPDDAPAFDGDTYEAEKDHQRLGAQSLSIFRIMRCEAWFTLGELAFATLYPEASISARLRDFRKPKFGAHTIERRRRNARGLYEYRLLVNPQARLDMLGVE